MKKRILSTVCSFFVLCTIILNISLNANAEEVESEGHIVDGSLLTHDESSKGTSSNPMLRGKHLMTGDSAISRAGVGKIYVYGQTTANHDVDYVAVLLYVERYNEETDGWGAVTDYLGEARNTYYVTIDDTLKVDRGHYYRVHCEHIAGNDDEQPYDTSVSATNGIWIP